MLGLVDGRAGNVLTGGQAEKAGDVSTIGKAVEVADLAHEGEGVADTGAGRGLEQLGLRPIFDQCIAGLEQRLLMLVGQSDLGDQIVDPLMNDLTPHRTRDQAVTLIHELLRLIGPEGRTGVGCQKGGEPIDAGGDELFWKDSVLKHGRDGRMMGLFARKNADQHRVMAAPHR